MMDALKAMFSAAGIEVVGDKTKEGAVVLKRKNKKR